MTSTSNRRFTTADLENLTEGTTPGPWEPFHDTWEDYGPDGEVTAEYEQWGIIGAADGILDTPPRQSLMDAPNQWADSGEHDNQANTRLAAAAPDLAHTVIEQAAQIKRLQAAVTESEVIFWEATGHNLEQALERKGVKLNHNDLEDR